MSFFKVPAMPPMPRLGLAAWRNRIVFHGVFLLLALATVTLAVTLLREEKARSYQRYAQSFGRSLDTVAARLRHPTGQLALLNPEAGQDEHATPLLLPFSAIDFDDPQKARSAVEMSGCALHYANGASLCLAVGSNAYAGGFVYAVGSLEANELVARERGQLDLSGVHRVRVKLSYRGQTQQWIAPFEAMDSGGWEQRGRLTGFASSNDVLAQRTRPERDFRGWIWREGPCLKEADDCPRLTMFSLRLPVAALQEALMLKHERMIWPPRDLARMELRIELLGPDGKALFDSAAEAPQSPITLQSLSSELQAGEVLTIEHAGKLVTTLRGHVEPDDLPSPWLTRLIRHLPLNEAEPQLVAHDSVGTPLGRYDLNLSGDVKSVDRFLSAGAARVSWLVGGMLGAIFLAWLALTTGLMRRIARLTKRAAAVSYNMQPARIDERIGELDVADLRGSDEIGILAGTIADLLDRAKLALRREQLRAEHERDMWHAVGHEIMSPLQSLLALHPDEEHTSRRYLLRMQQAVRVLYGTASPSEALASAQFATEKLDLAAFAAQLADNAAYAGIEGVVLTPWSDGELWVNADEYSLEDVVTHVLRNAQRYRQADTPITLSLHADAGNAVLSIHNRGPKIAEDQLEKIFEYGVSDTPASNGERRGQGLFVARSYLAKMDGRIEAVNAPDGVSFVISLPTNPG
ncbi:MAG TPA: HAMP domain-containing sensor histidine kinase [Burkholderiaceae bacterium]|jgi:signal transduction histidine kinase